MNRKKGIRIFRMQEDLNLNVRFQSLFRMKLEGNREDIVITPYAQGDSLNL